MELQSSKARRIGPRSMVHLPVHLRLQSDHSTRQVELKDIGPGGLAFVANVDLRNAEPVEIIISVPFEISLTENIQVRLTAEVLRVEARADNDGFTSALQFLDPVN